MCDIFCDNCHTFFCDTFLTIQTLQGGSVTIFEHLSDSQVVTMTKSVAEDFSKAIMICVQFQIRDLVGFDALNHAAGKDV